jgi:hypothetical protein
MNISTSLSELIDSLQHQIRTSPDSLSLIVFRTHEHISATEREKLVEWGELVLSNHAPNDAMAAAWPQAGVCLMTLAGAPMGTALDVASRFGDQLNKLPVDRRAPGNGWAWQVLPYAGNRAGLVELVSLIEESLPDA